MCVRGRRYPPYADFGEVLTDHWVKGPHHFWIDVATNLMIREWQPFNGLQTYHDWNLTRPEIKLDPICYTGLLRKNVSCLSPAPNSSVE